VNDLYKRNGTYEYTAGFNRVAIAALALGVAPSLPGFVAALRGIPLTTVFGTIYNWAWFVGFLVAGLLYCVGRRLNGVQVRRTVGAGAGSGG